LRCLAGAEERLARSVDQMDIDAIGQIGKAQDLIGAPVAAGDPLGRTRRFGLQRLVQN